MLAAPDYIPSDLIWALTKRLPTPSGTGLWCHRYAAGWRVFGRHL